MDGQTLINLEIFGNNADGGKTGKCLFYPSTLNFTIYFRCKFQYAAVKSVLLEFQVHYTNILITV